MKKRIEAVQLQRTIRKKLSAEYAKSRAAELEDLRKKFGHLQKQKLKAG